MTAGMSTSCFFGRETVEDAVDIMGGMGIKTAEVFLNTFSEYRVEYVRMLKKKTEDAGITVYSVHPHGVQYEPQLFSQYERSRKDAEEIFRQVLEAAALLGAKNYVFHGGIALKRSGAHPNVERIAGIVDGLCRISAEYGVKFLYENVHWCWFNRPEFAELLLKYTDNENLGFTLDVKQAAQSGYPVEEYISAMRGRICNLHICDFIKVENGVRPTLPFKGELDFPAIKKAVGGYGGAAVLEVYADNYRDYGELKETYKQLSAAL